MNKFFSRMGLAVSLGFGFYAMGQRSALEGEIHKQPAYHYASLLYDAQEKLRFAEEELRYIPESQSSHGAYFPPTYPKPAEAKRSLKEANILKQDTRLEEIIHYLPDSTLVKEYHNKPVDESAFLEEREAIRKVRECFQKKKYETEKELASLYEKERLWTKLLVFSLCLGSISLISVCYSNKKDGKD